MLMNEMRRKDDAMKYQCRYQKTVKKTKAMIPQNLVNDTVVQQCKILFLLPVLIR